MCKGARRCRSRGVGVLERSRLAGRGGGGGQTMLGVHNWEHLVLIPTHFTFVERVLLKTFQNLSVSSPAPVTMASPSGDMAYGRRERPLSPQLQAPGENTKDILPAVTRDNLSVQFGKGLAGLRTKGFFEKHQNVEEGMCVRRGAPISKHMRMVI